MRNFCYKDKDRNMSKGNSNIQEFNVAFRRQTTHTKCNNLMALS